ncbi:[protein-PII] uridylyltransferase [bacterium]|nr:[protein-PII] uridylyltransferase [Mariniblastus sp.]MDB4483661.1 [protein-PII] uridylyltransferase [bacterium]
MTNGIGIRPNVLESRERWKSSLVDIRELHDQGASGRETCHLISDLLDSILIKIYEKALAEISPGLASRISLVLLGGCGRRDVAPFSDVDLMVLYQGSLTDDIVEFSRRISQDITDSGFQLGYSLRTPRDACSMSLKDAYIFSSLTEARLLAGNEELFRYFAGRFKRITNRKTFNIIKAIIAAREKERVEFGETVYLLRPNVKKSRGGLRDIHLVRWLGYVQFGETDINRLLAKGALSTADSTQLNNSSEFLLRVRNEMHFHANRAHDGLGRNEQVRLAERFGFSGDDALLSVEEFMRQYFRYTSRIHYICEHFVAKSTSRKKAQAVTLLEPLVTRQIDDHFRMGATQIGVTKPHLESVKKNLEQVLRLMQLACLHDKTIEHDTWIAIRHEMLKNPDIKFTRESARRFMALLSNTHGLASQLRRLHEMKVLWKIVPEFEHARGLLQFNEYHKYTVDEHSMQALENLTKFADAQNTVGATYRNIREKNILHLAILLHDLGKGFHEDHSEVGRRIAASTGERFDLTEDETETIKFLVHNHLVMSHLALHRDTNDDEMVAEFASNVGSVQMLSMLYVLTCADISAVGPGVLNPWKQGLLTGLYKRAKSVLSGENENLEKERFDGVYNLVAAQAETEDGKAWLRNKVETLPSSYCESHAPETIATRLNEIRRVNPREAICDISRLEKSKLYEICIGKVSSRRTGIFYKITGMLSSLGLQIRAADIKPMGDSLVFYWIQFEDKQFSKPNQARYDDIKQRALDLVLEVDENPPRFPAKWQKEESAALKLSRPEIRVKIDNETVSSATIIDVFAYDKSGLLYKLTKKIHRLGLDVTYARISTYAHQVIDVFYVTDEQGNKIRNRNQLQLIKNELLQATRNFLEPPESTDP